MGVKRRELAERLGVTKQTIANYIQSLDLGDHVSNEGNYQILDDYAASAIADAIGKRNPEGTETRQASESQDSQRPMDILIEAYSVRVAALEAENARLRADLEDERERHEREVDDLRKQVVEANERADDAHCKLSSITERLVETQERQQMIQSLPWWKRGAVAMRLLTGGGE